MPVSYVGAIKSVLETYPPSKGLFREILQNSEDAKATQQIFVLDRRGTSDSSIESHDTVQSPALLAYNNASFTDKDFQSIFTLWESSKKCDNSKIGKFGMGFRATFHMTDTPQILSSSKVAILDPLDKNGQMDRLIDLESQKVCDLIFESFALGFFENGLTPARAKKFGGTVVRLPLRSAASKISGEVFLPDDIHKLLVDFIKDEIRIALLFLTNIASIEVHEIDENGNITCLAKSTIDREAEIDLEELLIDMHSASFFDLEETYKQGRKIESKRWRILRLSFSQQLVEHRLSKRLGFDASNALREHKLRSDLAIAVELSILKKASSTIGRIFTYLPLPLFTKFCVHVHGLFALTPSREKLQNREETPARGSDYHISLEWNRLLFEDYLPKAWVSLLRLLAKSNIKNVFAAWPPPQMSEQLGDSGYWENLPDNVVKGIIESKCRVWPLYGSSGEFCDIGAVLVAGNRETKKLLNALTAAGLKITQPPNFVVDILKRGDDVKFLSPQVVYASLLEVAGALAADDFEGKLPVITDYLISNDNLEYIVDLPVIPVGDFRIALTHCGVSETDHVLLESREFALFGSRDDEAISLGEVSQRLAELLKDRGPDILNVQILSPEIVLTYLEGFIPSVDWVTNFWTWMKEWSYGDELYSQIGRFCLLPTQEGMKQTSRPVFGVEDIDSELLFILKELHISFLDPAFRQPARSALIAFKALGNLHNLAEFLDALDLTTIASFDANEKVASQLVDYLKTCTFKKLNRDQRKKLRHLPIFPSPLRIPQVRVRIPEDYAVFGADLEDLSLLPILTRTVILGGSRSGTNLALLQALDPNIRGFLSDLDVLRLGIEEFDSQPPQTQQEFVDYMASNKSRVPSVLVDTVGNTGFVTASDGSKRCPLDLVDPQSSLAFLYETEKKNFPDGRDQTKLIVNLRALNLMKASLSTEILAERINYITDRQDQKCARSLIQLIFETKFKLSKIDEQWLPTPKGLLGPDNCRDDPEHAELFDRVLSPLDPGLQTDASFRAMFGWDKPVSVEVLTEQLSQVLVDEKLAEPYNTLSMITRELISRTLSSMEIRNLKDAVSGRKWVPVLGKRQQLVETEFAVFLDENISAGFYPIAIPGERSHNFFTQMGCSERPAVGAILKCLSLLADEVPSIEITKKSRRLLLLLPTTMSDDERSQIVVPDINYTLRPLHSVFFNDIGDRSILVNFEEDGHIAHSMIDESLARSLHMERLGLKYLDLKPFGIDMGEQLTTTITNKLRSYTPRQILTEFVANASDAGATEFGIYADKTHSKGRKLLNTSLAEILNGSSIVLYNNSVFTQSDFDGICRTGVGGKSSRRDTIGQFGFGALTMFHLADFATIISGKSVLFLDPSKEYLPIQNRATLTLPLEIVRGMYPDHLRPVNGMFGFDMSADDYNGTLFFLPLRKQENLLGEAWNLSSVTRDIIEPFKESAEEYLLFTQIHQLTVTHRSKIRRRETISEWRMSSKRKGKKKCNGFTSTVLDITVSDNQSPIKSQHWNVVSSSVTTPQELEPRLQVKYRLRSPVVLSLAAKVDHEDGTPISQGYKFFSTLPLSSSSLPVHLSAPFILSDDRRQIRLDNLDPGASNYNRWLLESACQPLYFFLLSALLEQHNNIPWWPGNNKEDDEFTELVTHSFYQEFLKTSRRRVFLTAQGVKSTPQDVVVGNSETYAILEEACRLIELPFVHMPSRVARRALDGGICHLTPTYLRSFLDSHPADLGKLSFDGLHKLMLFLLREGKGPENLVGLRLLPLSFGGFGLIESSETPTQTYFVAPETVHRLFPKSPRLVDLKFGVRNASPLLQTTGINVVEFSGQSLHLLLGDAMEERTVSKHGQRVQTWIAEFWKAYPDLKSNLADIKPFPLVPTAQPGTYTSIVNCEDRSEVVLTNHDEDPLFSDVLSSLGLLVVDRHSKGMPNYISNIVLSGGKFPTRLSFEDLLLAMETKHVFERTAKLDIDHQEVLSQWCLKSLAPIGRSISAHLVRFARKLPIWPVIELDGRSTYRSANDVKMLPRFITAEIAERFMEQPCTVYNTVFKQLGGIVLNFAEVFNLLSLPQALSERDLAPYQKLLTTFLHSKQRASNPSSFHKLRIPNSDSVLRHPRDLYARDPLFLAAFASEEAPPFILEALSDLEHYFIDFGMKRQSDLNAEVFATCAQAFHDASMIYNVDIEHASVIFGVYCDELPLHIQPRQPNPWPMIDRLRFIPRDVSRRKSPAPRGMDPATYVKVLPAIVSPNELLLPEFEFIAWTQRAHFLHPPANGDRILIANPGLGHPSFHDVVEHLKILTTRVSRDFPSSPLVLKELEATYMWLNDYCDDNDDANQLLVTLRKQPLFLNVSDPSKDMWEWCAAEQLLSREREDVGGYIAVKTFLQPFEQLLQATGAETVHHPPIPAASIPPSDSQQLISIRKRFTEMREGRVLTDVEFIAGDDEEEILPCHRTFLATYSSFFYDLFSNEMEDNLNVSVRNPKSVNVEEFSSRCVSSALNFAYAGTIDDASSDDLDLMMEMLKLSDFWQMGELHKKAQWLIGSKRFINIATLSRIREAADQFQGKELLEMCHEWQKLNKRLV